MAAETLKRLKEVCKYQISNVRDTNRLRLPVEPVVVIDINRYLTDPTDPNNESCRTTSEKADPSVDVYDVTLADSNNKMKVQLACHLHHFIQQGKMVVGSFLEVSQSVVVYDEMNLEDDGVLVLCDVSIVGYEPENVEEMNNLPWYPENSVRQTECRPLTSARGCYLNLWTSSDVVVPQTTLPDSEEIDEDQFGDVHTISEVTRKWKSVRDVKPALLVRVLRKSRLLHFGKPHKDDKWPFQLQLLVGDSSGICTLVFWNSLAVKFLTCVEEGTVLFLRNFNVKKTFLLNPGWYYSDSNLKVFDFDLNLNPHHPVSEVRLIKHSSLPRKFRFPNLAYNFITRCQLGSLPVNFVCDVTGMVTYVGHVTREAVKSRQFFDSGGFWLYRWIHVMDNTSDSPIIMQLYRTNQCSVFDDLCPDQLLLCRHMRVVYDVETVTSSRQRRHIYLTSTAVSQYYTYDHVRSNREHQFEKEALVKDLRSWRKRLKMDLVIFRTGGYYSYPPMPLEMQNILRSPITITPSGEQWCNAVKNLAFRERKILFVQAKLGAVWSNRNSERIQVANLDIDSSLTVGMDSELDNDVDLWPKEFDPQCDQMEKDFPPSFERGGASENGSQTNMLMLWLGLNERILLHTAKPLMCNTDNVTFVDLVAGRCDSNTFDSSQISQKGLERCLMSARDVLNQRFFLVVDLYRTSASSVNIVLKRAFLL
ncbi:RPA-related protein RADX-like [Gigantopelta aegis]|uniref:RPA-related protein RADX-like n=1 Tax=Gigantopelta aegis TaxID=1735272 RepID=UPI001B887438|nr:RPA-related protein RADX-like [Gigantopelta aegis]